MSAKFIVVCSTANNKPWEPANWRTVTETATITQALTAFDNYAYLAVQKATDYQCRTNQPVITQVAIFKLDGPNTFTNRPRYHADYRDKSGWPIANAVSGLVNAMNSDGSLNIRGN
jgi:hypothetical protein